jgi:hypothetical protein
MAKLLTSVSTRFAEESCSSRSSGESAEVPLEEGVTDGRGGSVGSGICLKAEGQELSRAQPGRPLFRLLRPRLARRLAPENRFVCYSMHAASSARLAQWSRWMFAEGCIRQFNDTPTLKKITWPPLDPRNFMGTMVFDPKTKELLMFA